MSDITVASLIGSVLLTYVPAFIRNGYTYAYAGAIGTGELGQMNTNPRKTLPEAIEKIEDEETQEFLQRSYSTHQNLLETMPFLFGGLATAKLAGVSNRTIDRCALVYLVSAGAYTWLYMSKPSVLKGRLRSLFFAIRSGSMYVAMGCALGSARNSASWWYPAGVVGAMVGVVDLCYGLSMVAGSRDGKAAKEKAISRGE